MRALRLGRVGGILPVLLALATACEDGSDATAPNTGTIRVLLATSGDDASTSGLTVRLDGGPAWRIGVSGSVTISGVEAGTYTVRLEGLPANCSVNGEAERTLTVAAGQETTADFAMSCVARVGDITVTTTTTGADVDVDPDGYSVEIWSCYYYYACFPLGLIASKRIGPEASETFPALREDYYEVRLTDIAPNCTLAAFAGVVRVRFAAVADVAFAIHCAARASLR